MAPMPLSQSIVQALASDIVAGRLASGYRLDEQSIAKRFKVSRSPVRDALRHLVATQLVEYLPRRGFLVARIDKQKLEDLYEGLSEIEALCARLFAVRAGATDRAALELVHAAAKDAAERNDATAYAAINEEFHTVIYAGSRNQTLQKIALETRQRLAPFRSKLFFERGRFKVSLNEHETIVKAILGRDAEKAAEAVRSHTSRTAINVITLLSEGLGVPAKRESLKRGPHKKKRAQSGNTARKRN